MDVRELKKRMRMHDMSAKSTAFELEISRSALFRKLGGKTEFTLSEITALIKLLELSSDDVIDIFFDEQFAQSINNVLPFKGRG